MSIRKILQHCLYLSISVMILSACSEPAEPLVENAVESPTAIESAGHTEPPVGQLDNTVTPVRYNLDLRIDPSRETFSGKVAIDVMINEQVDSIWLHGKNLDVTGAYLTKGDSNRIEATYEQRLESGVALVSFSETVAAGAATLHFIYTAPFNTSTNALFKVVRGEENFQAGVRLHMERHADGTATAEDFMASLAEGSGRAELIPAFKSFIEQPGVPLVSASVNCDDGQNAILEVSQSRYAPLGSTIDPNSGEWEIPVCVSYDDNGTQKSTCAMLNERSKSIKLDSNTCPSGLHPNADGAGYYRFSLDESWWNGLIADVPDLPPADALVLADSMGAAFHAGKLPGKTLCNRVVRTDKPRNMGCC
jgi:aminopeptidase N